MRKCEQTLTKWDGAAGAAVMYVTESRHDEVATVTLTLANQHKDRRRPHTDTGAHVRAHNSSAHASMCERTHVCTHAPPIEFWDRNLLFVRAVSKRGVIMVHPDMSELELCLSWLPALPSKSAWFPSD